MSSKQFHDATRDLLRATADLQYLLCLYGEDLAKEQNYKSLSGIEAVHFYLIERYKWTPAVVMGLNYDDLHFLMKEKMHGWRAPPSAISNSSNSI